jgi:hypothetical protein
VVLAVISLSTVGTVTRIPITLAAITTMPSNQTTVGGGGTGGNMTFLGNMMPKKNMTMPGGNMTFGASLQNAKMHLMEAIMVLFQLVSHTPTIPQYHRHTDTMVINEVSV